jgi:uncharacterized protein (TIGR03066 family)
MRALLGVAILVLAVATSAAQPKNDDKKDDNATRLVGKWVPVRADGKLEPKLTEEFTKDGKYTLGGTGKGDGLTATYKVDGAKVTITIAGASDVRTIKKLTATDLEFGGKFGTTSYKRGK